jgi:predicted nuclease of restriction endonuclease-like (RecB) superfamily
MFKRWILKLGADFRHVQLAPKKSTNDTRWYLQMRFSYCSARFAYYLLTKLSWLTNAFSGP